jgi:hypothetical protein
MQAALFLRTEAAHVSLDGDEVSLLVHEHLLEARHPRQAAVHHSRCHAREDLAKRRVGWQVRMLYVGRLQKAHGTRVTHRRDARLEWQVPEEPDLNQMI